MGAAAMESYFDLGSYTRGTSTASTSAQMWFDRGLVWSYAFHHEEAIRCFERAVEHDPGFALAHWGIAYASGCNYNRAWDVFGPQELVAAVATTRRETELALAQLADVTPIERALVEACGDPPSDACAREVLAAIRGAAGHLDEALATLPPGGGAHATASRARLLAGGGRPCRA